jgi:phospholipase/lecithinase/hemolysin
MKRPQCLGLRILFTMLAILCCASLACLGSKPLTPKIPQLSLGETTSAPAITATSSPVVTATLSPAETMTLIPVGTATAPSVATATTGSPSIVGIGVLGDSNSDEYRADDNRGGSYASQTYGWLELVVLWRKLNFGTWGNWGEPRRTGYQYNWARSSATAHDMVETGQHTGLAQQVANGEVSHVIIWIGTNDFATWNDTYQEIYDDRLNGEALQAKIKGVVDDITLAVDTILRAGKVNLLLITISDRNARPDIAAQFPDPDKRNKVSEAIRATNIQLLALAQSRGIAVFDIDLLVQSMSQRVDTSGMLSIGNEQINVFVKGNEPHFGLLDDSTGHFGTILSGLVANEIFIKPFNLYFDTNILELSDQEILQSAGLLER